MNLFDKIKSLYPDLENIDFFTVITLQNDADGKDDYIADWKHPTIPKPTEQQLDSIE